ncbi:MAG TPA: DinB family protein [Actinomycetes bacterium]|nr:DinB family protein [Actinomycetes bacterium]
MGAEYVGTDELRAARFAGSDLSGATFTESDLSGASFSRSQLSGATFSGADLSGAIFSGSHLSRATIRDSDLRGLKVADSWLGDVYLSGDIEHLVVNDVDVTAYVESELDHRHPERVQARSMRTAEDHRGMWDTLERLWAETVARAERLPEAGRFERVDDEWSFVETLRHLVFATDAWASSAILGEERPYHRLGYPYSSYPREEAAALGVDVDAEPTYDEVMAARASRMAVVRGILDRLTDEGLERPSRRLPAPGYEDVPRTVRSCLRVIVNEECEHRRYAERDLAVLESR